MKDYSNESTSLVVFEASFDLLVPIRITKISEITSDMQSNRTNKSRFQSSVIK